MSVQKQETASAGVLKTMVHYNKEVFRFKFPADKKIYLIQQFLKRKVHLKPVESIFLFDKHRKSLIQSHMKLSDIAHLQSYSKDTDADCQIVMRLSETY